MVKGKFVMMRWKSISLIGRGLEKFHLTLTLSVRNLKVYEKDHIPGPDVYVGFLFKLDKYFYPVIK